jgi:hypothetical protein
VALPNPIPDNPLRWEGWRQYNSPNYYDRLCLDFESNPAPEQIEDHCRQLLVWWQKKLPLKNQLSNPLTQMLRAGLDEAPVYLVEARTILLDVEARQKHDAELRSKVIGEAFAEFGKLISFSISDGELSSEDEERLVDAGRNLGLTREEATAAIERGAATGACASGDAGTGNSQPSNYRRRCGEESVR